MHSGEDIFSMFVMLSLSMSTPGKMKSLLDRGGNRTHDLWFANPMLCQLSYEVKSVRVDHISELSLVPSTKSNFRSRAHKKKLKPYDHHA